MDLMSFVKEQAIILLPVLFVIGEIIKQTDFIKDKYIPVCLLVLSVLLTNLLLGFGIESFIQGIIIAGATVGIDQLPKQLRKVE